MRLFWERGFHATSIQDLIDHLGISRASLYSTFGDKHSLLLAALRRYQEVVGGAIKVQLARQGPVRDQIAAILREVVHQQFTSVVHRGCFIVNSTTELAANDAAVAALLTQIGADLQAAFVAAIEAGQVRGEISYRHEPAALARFLLLTYSGLMVMARQADSPDTLEEVLDIALTVLDG